MTKPHWLQEKGITKTPKVVVCFDTETRWIKTPKGQLHTLRCWDAVVRGRNDPDLGRDHVYWAKGERAIELAESLERSCELVGETWAIAHNVGFDLTVTQLPVLLSERSWYPHFVHVGDESAVFVLKRGKHKLVITDSWSWLRCSLEDVAKDMSMRKVVLPEEQDSLEAWHKRCKHDVVILDRAMNNLMTWWEKNDLGGFGTTGSSCGWRAMRAKTLPRTLLVGSDQTRSDLERSAVFGGRKEVYQVGTFSGSWVADYDLAGAYPTAAAALPLPCTTARAPKGVDDPLSLSDFTQVDFLAEVEISTDTPIAPVRIEKDVWWPVGKFRTVLSGPEIRYVAQFATVRVVGSPQWYKMSHALANWASWCLSIQGDVSGDTPPVVRRVAKGWGRSVIGRFALKTSELIGTRQATRPGWHFESGHDLDTGHPIQVITYGGIEYTYRQDVDGSEVNPAILAFVEGYVRIAIDQAMRSVDPSKLLQVNTDGWWERRANPYKWAETLEGPWPFQIVRKALAREITVLGPNHVETPTERRWAGIPRDAETMTDGRKSWLDWPSMKWQMEHSAPGEYVRPNRTAILEDHYCRRWVLDNGETLPVECDLDASGATTILPWSQTQGRWQGDNLAAHQVASLQKLVDSVPALFVPPRGSGVKLPGRHGHLI